MLIAIFHYHARGYLKAYTETRKFDDANDCEDRINAMRDKPAWAHLFEASDGHAIATYSQAGGFEYLH